MVDVKSCVCPTCRAAEVASVAGWSALEKDILRHIGDNWLRENPAKLKPPACTRV